MALRWNWSECVGRVEVNHAHGSYVANLYEGNATIIEIWESEDGKQYQLTDFWADRDHMLNCFNDSIYANATYKYTFYYGKFMCEKGGMKRLSKLIKDLTEHADAYADLEIHIIYANKIGGTDNEE